MRKVFRPKTEKDQSKEEQLVESYIKQVRKGFGKKYPYYLVQIPDLLEPAKYIKQILETSHSRGVYVDQPAQPSFTEEDRFRLMLKLYDKGEDWEQLKPKDRLKHKFITSPVKSRARKPADENRSPSQLLSSEQEQEKELIESILQHNYIFVDFDAAKGEGQLTAYPLTQQMKEDVLLQKFALIEPSEQYRLCRQFLEDDSSMQKSYEWNTGQLREKMAKWLQQREQAKEIVRLAEERKRQKEQERAQREKQRLQDERAHQRQLRELKNAKGKRAPAAGRALNASVDGALQQEKLPRVYNPEFVSKSLHWQAEGAARDPKSEQVTTGDANRPYEELSALHLQSQDVHFYNLEPA